VDIDIEIQKLITELRKDFQVPPYIYNNVSKFIPGVTPIYYSGAYFNDKEIIAAVKSLLVGKWMTAGEKVKEFEHGFSRKINQSFSVMTNSGSSANLVMLTCLKKFYGWEDNKSEIIVSAVGFPTTYSVIVQNNLIPVFIDIEMDSLNFDLNVIESKINSNTVAILLSPVLGNPPDMDKLVNICYKYNIKLVLDNCDSLGSKWNGKFLNEYAEISSCSFYAAHEICTFEGGMVSSNNRGLMHIARSLVNWGRGCICSGAENLLPQGICNHRWDNWLEDYGYDGIIDHKYLFSEIGYNLKPLDLCGAVGVEQLEKLDEICQKRKYHYSLISEFLRDYIEDIYVPDAVSWRDSNPVWFGVPVVCKNRELKEKLVKYFESQKIQVRNYFAGSILMQPAYKNLGNYKDYPNAATVLEKVFFLGVAPHYTNEMLKYIEQVIEDFPND
jgi:CDP-4-dehydro-6-deoxyglucose reductase, E1